jgi:hypothetical protein
MVFRQCVQKVFSIDSFRVGVDTSFMNFALEKVYGAGKNWASEEVQEDLRNLAISVLRQALRGKEVSPAAMKAAELVVTRTVWKDNLPRNVTLQVTADQLQAAKRKAGLLCEPQKNPQENKADTKVQ